MNHAKTLLIAAATLLFVTIAFTASVAGNLYGLAALPLAAIGLLKLYRLSRSRQ